MAKKITKGKLAKRLASSTTGRATAKFVTSSVTALDIFNQSIARAQNLVKIHTAAHGKASKPPSYLADTHRAAIVLAVAALDALIRTLVVERIVGKLSDVTKPVPQKLKEQAKEFLGVEGLFEAARNSDLGSRLEKEFRIRFESKSFQGVRNIEDAMQLVGYEKVFHLIAMSASVNEDNLKRDLEKFTRRRHIIAHCGDYDLNQVPPLENKVSKQDVKDCIAVVKLVASEICNLK